MLSLKLFPDGWDTLMQTLVLFVWGIARIAFALKFSRGGHLNGPATNFFDTQLAIVLVTLSPWVIEFWEFFMTHGPSGLDWKAGAPFVDNRRT